MSGIFLNIGIFASGNTNKITTEQIVSTLFGASTGGALYDVSQRSSLFQDSSGTIPVTADGDPVGRINDLSGNSKHATQTVAGSRPTYRAGGWLEFDGVDDHLISASTLAASVTVIGAFSPYFDPTVAPVTQVIMGARTSATTTGTYIGTTASGAPSVRSGTAAAFGSGADTRNSKTVVAVTANGALAALYRDKDGMVSSAASSGHSTTIGMMIGAYNGNGTAQTFYKGKFYGAAIVEGIAHGSATINLAVDYFGYDKIATVYETWPLESAVELPDGAGGSDPGKGFTCTGLGIAADNTWWVGNHGRNIGSNFTTYAPSLVHLSEDFSTILGEITVASLGIGPTGFSVQGLFVDPSDDTIWVLIIDTIGSGSVLAHITQAGAMLGSWTVSNTVSGVSIDHFGMLVLKTSSAVLRRAKLAPDVTLGPQVGLLGEHIFPVGTKLLVPGGANGSNGYVNVVDNTKARLPLLKLITLEGFDAPEGVVLHGGKLYCANDSYYHPGNPALNRILIYDASTIA